MIANYLTLLGFAALLFFFVATARLAWDVGRHLEPTIELIVSILIALVQVAFGAVVLVLVLGIEWIVRLAARALNRGKRS